MSLRAFIAAAASLTVSIGSPASSAPLQPTEKWHVFFDEEQCVAQRNYGSKEHPVYLILKQPALGDVLQMAVARDAGFTTATEFDGTFAFDDQSPHKASFLIYQPSGQRLRLYSTNIPIPAFDAARGAKVLRVTVQGFDESFELRDVAELVKVMNSCAQDLANYWNISKAAGQANLTSRAKGNLQGLFSADDYPSDALQAHETGKVKVAVLINEKGRVADCSVIETSGVAVLDAQACAAIKNRARFTPSVGKDGKPSRDGFMQTIVWQLM